MRTLFCSLLLLCTLAVAAQGDSDVYLPGHRKAVSFNPLALANYDQMLMPGMEWRSRRQWSVVADVGIVVNSGYLREENTAGGFALRPALRYYHGRVDGGYIQMQFQYARVRYKLYDWLGKDCVDGVPAYERLQHFVYRKQTFSAAFVAGRLLELGPHWFVDISAGLGVQQRVQGLAGGEACCFVPQTTTFANRRAQERSLLPIVPVAAKLVYTMR